MGQSQENGFIDGRTELSSWEPAAEPGVKKSFFPPFRNKMPFTETVYRPGSVWNDFCFHLERSNISVSIYVNE